MDEPEELIVFNAAKGTSFFPTFLSQESLTKDIKEVLGVHMPTVFSMIKNDDHELYFFQRKSWKDLCNKATEKIEEKDFAQEVGKQILDRSTIIRTFANTLSEEKIRTATNKQIVEILNEFYTKTKQLRSWGWIPNLVNIEEKNIVDKTFKEIKEKKNLTTKEANVIFSKLTTITNRLEQNNANDNMLRILREMREETKDIFNKEVREIKENLEEYTIKEIENHVEKFGHLTYHYKGPSMNMNDCIGIIKNKLENEKREGKESKSWFEEIKSEQEIIIKEYNIEEDLHNKLETIKKMTFLKAHRKEVMIYSNYKMDLVLKEIANRINGDKSLVRHMLREEIEHALLKKRIENEEEIRKRTKEHITYSTQGKVKILQNKEKIRMLKKLANKEILNKDRIEGQCAFPGYTKGRVKIIDKKEDISKMKEGNILVSRSTNPNLIIAMEQAAGIVTDMGGITCHAAIVSRELQIPCIIGTKHATKLLKDGMLIEVDANKGTINIIKE